jgi:four helix bundle protein
VFISKFGIVVEESDEAIYWLEMLGETGIVRPFRLKDILQEANELTSILVASQRTATGKRKKVQQRSQAE